MLRQSLLLGVGLLSGLGLTTVVNADGYLAGDVTHQILDLSDQTLSDGNYVQHTFESIPQDQLLSTTVTGIEIQLKANQAYVLYFKKAVDMRVLDSDDNTVASYNPGGYHEGEGLFRFRVPKDSVYRIVVDDYDESLEHMGFGGMTTSLELYEMVVGKQTIDFKDLQDNVSFGGSERRAFAVEDNGYGDFNLDIVPKGNVGSYTVNSDQYYHPLPGFSDAYFQGRTGVTKSFGDGEQSFSLRSFIGFDTDEVDFVKFGFGNDVSAGSGLQVTSSSYKKPNISLLKATSEKINFFDRAKSFLGDPVDMYSGAFTDNRLLMRYGGTNGLKLSLAYNSMTTKSGLLTNGWIINFESKLVVSGDQLIYKPSPNVSVAYQLDESGEYLPNDERLAGNHLDVVNGLYVLTTVDDGSYMFNSDGLLIKRTYVNGSSESYTYLNGLLTEVSNSYYQTFKFSYDGELLKSVVDGAGRTVTFNYENDQLISINTPSDKLFGISYDGNGYVNKLTYGSEQLVANTYNSDGQVVSQVNDKGIMGSYTYNFDADNHMISTFSENGLVEKEVHDGNGNLLEYTNRNGVKSRYTVDQLGRTTSATIGSGPTASYVYDRSGSNLLATVDGNGNRTEFKYDSLNHLSEVIDPLGHVASFMYDANGRLAKSVDKMGTVAEIRYDNNGNVIRETKTGPDGSKDETIYEYDENGYLIGTIVNGVKSTFKTDELGRQVASRTGETDTKIIYDVDNNVLTSIVGDQKTTNTYDDLGRVISTANADGSIAHFNYDNGLLQSATSALNYKLLETYAYDKNGRLSQTKVNNNVVDSLTYDNNGNVLSDKNNHDTDTRVYDEQDRLVSETVKGVKTTYTYDNNNNVISSKTGDAVTTFAYDALDELISKTDAKGVKTIYCYDAMGHLLSEQTGDEIVKHVYDGLGREVKTIDALGHETIFSYNAQGYLSSETNALGETVYYSYNELGQVVAVKNNRGEVTNRYTYDAYGNVKTISDSQRVVKTFNYDGMNRLVEELDAYGKVVDQKTFNTDGELIKELNANGGLTTFKNTVTGSDQTKTITDSLDHTTSLKTSYDGLMLSGTNSTGTAVASYTNGLLINQNENNQNKTVYSYNAVGDVVSDNNWHYGYDLLHQLTSFTNGRGDTTAYVYDDYGNVIKRGDDTYSYDLGNNLIKANDMSYEYDALNRLVKTDTSELMYDDRGFIIAEHIGDKTNHYKINTDGLMTEMTDSHGYKTHYVYDWNHRLVKTIFENGLVEERAYNTAGQLLTIEMSLYDKTLSVKHYRYDSEGNLISDGSQTYSYDDLNRLTTNHTYDLYGNVISYGDNSLAYTDGVLSRLNNQSVSYDKDGNITAYQLNGVSHTASFDNLNRLTSFDNVIYKYDGNDELIFDGDKQFTYDALGQVVSDGTYDYVYGADGLIGYYDHDDFYVYGFNQRGDVIAIYNSQGDVVKSFEYDVFGIVSDDANPTSFGFSGRYGIVTTTEGLVFLNSRFYNSELNQFMSTDTIAGDVSDLQSMNRHSYVDDNPLTFNDLNGHAASWIRNNPLDALELGLNGLSFIPGFGAVSSAVLAGIDLVQGDYSAAAMDALGVVPGGKLVNSSLKLGSRVLHSSELMSRVADSSNFLNQVSIGLQGEFVSKRAQYLEGMRNPRYTIQPYYKGYGGARTDIPNGINPQRHHILQDKWAQINLAKYGYDSKLAPTITLETGMYSDEIKLPHTKISNAQRNHVRDRRKRGLDDYGDSLQERLDLSREHLIQIGLSGDAVAKSMDSVYDMLRHLGVEDWHEVI